MTSPLIIHITQLPTSLGGTDGGDLPCIVITPTIDDSPAFEACTLGDIKTPDADTHVVVFIPAVHVLSSLVQAPKKQHKHLQQILPFLCEEKLATDIEETHIAAGLIHGETVAVNIVGRTWLIDLLAILKQHGIYPDALYSDAEPLRAKISNDESCLWLQHNRGLLVHQDRALSFEPKTAAVIVSLIAASPPTALTLYEEDTERSTELALSLEELKTQDIPISETTLPPDNGLMQTYQTQAIELTQGLRNNLLTGKFVPASKNTSQFSWRPLAVAASVLIGLNLAYLLGSGFYFHHQADQMHASSEALYREYFPTDRRIINMRAQTNNHLLGAQQQSGSGFLNLLAKFLPSWQQNSRNLSLKSMRYNQQRREMLIDIEGKTIAQLDQLQQSLGEQAELLSANEDSNNGVRGRIKFKGGR